MATYPTQQPDPLADESYPGLSFKDAPIGASYTVTIVEGAKMVQSHDYESGKPEFWDDGNPKMSVVLVVQLGDELRTLWAQKPSSMFRALVTAQKAAGGQTMAPGGILTVTLTKIEPPKSAKLSGQKIYEATYTPPAQRAGDPLGENREPEGGAETHTQAGTQHPAWNIKGATAPTARPTKAW